MEGLIFEHGAVTDPQTIKHGLIKGRQLQDFRLSSDGISVGPDQFPFGFSQREIKDGIITAKSDTREVRFAIQGIGSKMPSRHFTQFVWTLIDAVERKDEPAVQQLLQSVRQGRRSFALGAAILVFWIIVLSWSKNILSPGPNRVIILSILVILAIPSAIILASTFRRNDS